MEGESEILHKRVIVHIDIDCFYAQVEEILNPSLKGKPVGISQKNIVVTCNYAARSLGIQKLMFIKDAVKICPQMILCNGEDLLRYRKMSNEINNIIQLYSKKVERLGMDENFIDVTHLVDDYSQNRGVKMNNYSNNGSHDTTADDNDDKAINNSTKYQLVGHSLPETKEMNDDCTYSYDHHDKVSANGCNFFCYQRLVIGSIIAQEIRTKLFTTLQITSCAGISYNKTLAKLIGSSHKPNQQTTLFPSAVLSYMKSLHEIRTIPGIGSVMSKKLQELGITNIEQLQNTSRHALANQLNDTSSTSSTTLSTSSSYSSSSSSMSTAERIINLSRGVDDEEVKFIEKPKSIGAEDGFPPAFANDTKAIQEKLLKLLVRVWNLVSMDGRRPQCLKLTVRILNKLQSGNSNSSGSNINTNNNNSNNNCNSNNNSCNNAHSNSIRISRQVTLPGNFYSVMKSITNKTNQTNTTLSNSRSNDISSRSSSSPHACYRVIHCGGNSSVRINTNTTSPINIDSVNINTTISANSVTTSHPQHRQLLQLNEHQKNKIITLCLGLFNNICCSTTTTATDTDISPLTNSKISDNKINKISKTNTSSSPLSPCCKVTLLGLSFSNFINNHHDETINSNSNNMASFFTRTILNNSKAINDISYGDNKNDNANNNITNTNIALKRKHESSPSATSAVSEKNQVQNNDNIVFTVDSYDDDDKNKYIKTTVVNRAGSSLDDVLVSSTSRNKNVHVSNTTTVIEVIDDSGEDETDEDFVDGSVIDNGRDDIKNNSTTTSSRHENKFKSFSSSGSSLSFVFLQNNPHIDSTVFMSLPDFIQNDIIKTQQQSSSSQLCQNISINTKQLKESTGITSFSSNSNKPLSKNIRSFFNKNR